MQLRTSTTIQFFHNIFKEKFKFEEYTDITKPALFFGVYRDRDWRTILGHTGVKIVWFAGADSAIALDLFKQGKLDIHKYLDDACVVAESISIEKDLDEMGIKYEKISLCMDDIYKWKAVPHGNALYWYNAGTGRYGKELLPIIRKAFPNIEIITNDNHTSPRDQMPDIYARCFASIRPIEHDGMSQGVAEMALMGRYTIWNGNGPFSVKFEGVDGIISAIKRLREGYNYRLVAKRARGYFIENEAKFTDLILKLCGTDGIDATNMFYEDKKRPASFFRIMRKEDVEKIGGFGDGQFERQWISENITSIGKKMLLVSKNSGYNVLEWKGINNKGYDKGFNNFHTYDKKYS